MKLSQRPFLLYFILTIIFSILYFIFFNFILFQNQTTSSSSNGINILDGANVFNTIMFFTMMFNYTFIAFFYLIYKNIVKSSIELCTKYFQITTFLTILGSILTFPFLNIGVIVFYIIHLINSIILGISILIYHFNKPKKIMMN